MKKHKKLSGYYLVYDGQTIDEAIEDHNGGFPTLSEAFCGIINCNPKNPRNPPRHRIYKISTVPDSRLRRMTVASYHGDPVPRGLLELYDKSKRRGHHE